MIEDFRLNIEYLRFAYGGSILIGPIEKITEWSAFHKNSKFNSGLSGLGE